MPASATLVTTKCKVRGISGTEDMSKVSAHLVRKSWNPERVT
jgi:hypothetical protein